ncbi:MULTISPECIES: GNAT family N-acetyltransferase [unclassified Aureimonas]|uniref:GNAT family N-acetyltransferase n=1 Tax=unclassified Aureimonas TaxID=2615206 RepID=UPI00078048ED|nr:MULTISPECIES: GNAT family protein [unclassified Aureimonas]
MGWLTWVQASAQPVLNGPGILLRMPRPGDYERWRALREESRAFLTPWEPSWSPGELSRPAFRLRLSRYRRDARERGSYTFFVFDPTGQVLYGGLTLGRIQRGVAQSATLGYWMGERHAGRGIMSRAVRTICIFAFEIEGLHRVEAACVPRNGRSIGLLESCGFRREGHLRQYLKIAGVWEDHLLYSLLAEDWAASAGYHADSMSAPSLAGTRP